MKYFVFALIYFGLLFIVADRPVGQGEVVWGVVMESRYIVYRYGSYTRISVEAAGYAPLIFEIPGTSSLSVGTNVTVLVRKRRFSGLYSYKLF